MASTAARSARAIYTRTAAINVARRTYATPSRPAAATAQPNDERSGIVSHMDEVASSIQRTPSEPAPASITTPSPDAEASTSAGYPAHPTWVMTDRPEYHDPPVHAPTYGIHVATLTFTAFGPEKDQLVLATGFALQAAWHLGIPCTRPAFYPVKRELHTVLRSGFVHKKSQQNFGRVTHTRVVKAYDANEEVINRWINYLSDESVAANVNIDAKRYTYRRLGWGKQLEQEAKTEREVLAQDRAIDWYRQRSRPGAPKFDAIATPLASSTMGDASGKNKGGKAGEAVALSQEEQIKRLAEDLVESELRPKAEAAEAKMKAAGTEAGVKMSELEEVAPADRSGGPSEK